MFEFFFKFSAEQLREAQLSWLTGPAGVGFAALIGGLLLLLFFVYARPGGYPSRRTRLASLGLRVPALLLLGLPLFEPTLLLPGARPDEQFVAVLVDASESMQVRDAAGGRSRSEAAIRLLEDSRDGLLPSLGRDFKVRLYAFGAEPVRTDSLAGADVETRATDLSAALDRVLADFRDLPLAGVVLVTDGGDNGEADPLLAAARLRGRDVPLHVVGIGRERLERERELLDARVTRGVEETTGSEIEVRVRSWADEAEPVALELYRGDELVHTERRRLRGGGAIERFTLFYEPRHPEAAEYSLRVAEAADEVNVENNRVPLLLDARTDSIRVLYFEGQLRRDFKFVKRALEDDRITTFSSISRTGTGKFYRQGIASADELAGGFPRTEADLFRYHAVVLGDVEAAFFSPEQLRLVEKFVRVRGGGLLMLGGRNSFAEGGYEGSVIAGVLPVELDPARRTVPVPAPAPAEGDPAERGFPFVPTGEGLASPILRFSPDEPVNRALWAGMPRLTSLNLLGAPKPGAVVLAEKPADAAGGAEPLLVVQSYGRGRSAALATASTWRWQMLLDAEDQRHERFWRQMVRWLVASAPGRVELRPVPADASPGRPLTFAVEVFDSLYAPVPGAAVRGRLVGPDGETQELDFLEDLARAGSYTAAFEPADAGRYRLEVTAERNGAGLGAHARSFLVSPSRRELIDPTLRRPLLASLARAAGGAYHAADEAGAIPASLRERRTVRTLYRAESAWDVPALYALVVLLLSAEWLYRRRKGMP